MDIYGLVYHRGSHIFLFSVIMAIPESSECIFDYGLPLLKRLSKSGIKASLQSARKSKDLMILEIQRHRLAAVVFLDGLNLTASDNIIQVASSKSLYNPYITWIMVSTTGTITIIDQVLQKLNIGIDSNVILAFSYILEDKRTSISYILNGTTHNQQPGKPCEVHSSKRDSVNDDIYEDIDGSETVAIHLLEVYKIRINVINSMQMKYLGVWKTSTRFEKIHIKIEKRGNFHGYPLNVGVHNRTNDAGMDFASDEGSNDTEPLLDLIRVVADVFNATLEIRAFSKIGTVTNGAWSELLGGVVSGDVDIGLGYITMSSVRQKDMSFSYPLFKSMRSVYYRSPPQGRMRNIFLQPFNSYMLFCVASTSVITVAAMEVINYALKTVLLSSNRRRDSEFGGALLWCLCIMCMQGSPGTPNSHSGKIILLFSLFFATVINTAYSGLMTSILSVRESGIQTLDDLLQYDSFKVGYSLNEDEYLRGSNDSNLRKLYIKAFDTGESRLETIVGLERAVFGNYGFLVGAADARKLLNSLMIQNHCSLRELQLENTLSPIALPMAHTSSYKRIIDLSFFRLHEHGILDRMRERMLPEMPRCEELTNFNSASLVDVYFAFEVLGFGTIISVVLCFIENICKTSIFIQKLIKRWSSVCQTAGLSTLKSNRKVRKVDFITSQEEELRDFLD